jgi:phosphatidylglycerol:prolipoprotein diacylglycerol transferase
MCFEGFVLFGLIYALWKFFPKVRDHVMSLYLIGYGSARFVIEFFREPDVHIGINFLGMTRGQMLCSAMILSGVALWAVRWRLNEKIFNASSGKRQ